LVSNTYYSNDKKDLYGEEILENIFVIRLAKDFGSGFLTNLAAYLIYNGEIIDSLYNKNTVELNENFLRNVEDHRK
jgi:hypothetical protein